MSVLPKMCRALGASDGKEWIVEYTIVSASGSKSDKTKRFPDKSQALSFLNSLSGMKDCYLGLMYDPSEKLVKSWQR